jgi:hypothetical protein
VDPDWGWSGWGDNYPWGAGLAIGAAAAMAYGAYYYSLPHDCSPYYWGGYDYYHCGGVYYEPRYEGDTVVYVTVPDPSGGQGGAAAQQPAPAEGPPAAGTPPAEPHPTPAPSTS